MLTHAEALLERLVRPELHSLLLVLASSTPKNTILVAVLIIVLVRVPVLSLKVASRVQNVPVTTQLAPVVQAVVRLATSQLCSTRTTAAHRLLRRVDSGCLSSPAPIGLGLRVRIRLLLQLIRARQICSFSQFIVGDPVGGLLGARGRTGEGVWLIQTVDMHQHFACSTTVLILLNDLASTHLRDDVLADNSLRGRGSRLAAIDELRVARLAVQPGLLGEEWLIGVPTKS